MITTTLLLSFSFLSLLMLVLGMHFQSRIFFFSGGAFLVFLGILSLTTPTYEYNGTYNASYNWTTDNTTLLGQTQLPNFIVVDTTNMQFISIAYIVVGLISLYYGVTMRERETRIDRETNIE